MAGSSRATDTKSNEKSQPTAKPAVPERLNAGSVEPAQPRVGLGTAAGDGGVQSQAAVLGDAHLPRRQRQALIARIGRVQGNQHVQRVMASFQGMVIQRSISVDEAKTRIEEAGSGWGTDEDAIYAAIRECSDRAALKPQVESLLNDELSGHDLWKAHLLFHYGSESAFPDAVREIWEATRGLGTDEARITRALQRLSAADAAIIRNVPGLRDMLREELSGNDLQAATQLLSGDYARAIDRHKQNVAQTVVLLNQMRTGTTIEQNTAEWVAPTTPGASPRNDLHVCTETHDAQARAQQHGQGANKRAFFGAQEIFPDNSGDYDANIESTRNLRFIQQGTGGHHLSRDIWIYDPLGQGAFTKTILVHEVQHDADRHADEYGYGESGTPAERWNRYKTEFRAYWQDARYSATSDAHNPALAPWDNARQRRIYNGMVSSGIYPWLQEAYTENPELDGQRYQDLVHDYARPEGVNLENSPRIDDFYQRLHECTPDHTDLTAAPLQGLVTAANALDANDRAHVNSAAALRLQEMMKDNLSDAVLAHIGNIVNGGTAPAWLNVNIADARRAITEAGEGWGTDEQAIYDTIGNASAAERTAMRSDPAIRRVLYAELSGHDLWKAQLMLEFGPQASWPAAVREIFEATQGAGTDEARIRAALERLTRPQAEAIARVVGLRDMINSELSGQDLATTNQLLAGGYADAIANQQQDMAAISARIQAGLADADPAVRAIYVKLNDPAQCLIQAMTLTHNSAARASQANQVGKGAYFGANNAYPATSGRYDSLPANNEGVRFVTPGTTSQTAGRNLYIYEARNIAAGSLATILEDFGRSLA